MDNKKDQMLSDRIEQLSGDPLGDLAEWTRDGRPVSKESIPPFLRGPEEVPDILRENRKLALELTRAMLAPVVTVGQMYGLSPIELILESMPEEDMGNTDGVREECAAESYIKLRGSRSLKDICKQFNASRTVTYRLVMARLLEEEARRQAEDTSDSSEAENDVDEEEDTIKDKKSTSQDLP